MFGHRRRGFGGDESPVPSDGFASAGGYEEKKVFSVDGVQQNATGASAPTAAVAPEKLGDYDYTASYTAGERPRVFVSRENSGVYIYEYSDRLEYYVKLDSTMFKFNVVKKPLNK